MWNFIENRSNGMFITNLISHFIYYLSTPAEMLTGYSVVFKPVLKSINYEYIIKCSIKT